MKKLFSILLLVLALAGSVAAKNRTDSDSAIKTEYYDNGKIKSEMVVCDYTYKYIHYFESGSIETVGYYNHSGEKTGVWAQFSEDNKLLATAEYKDGYKHGDWKIYNYSGDLILYMKYKKGKRIEAYMWTEDKGLLTRK